MLEVVCGVIGDGSGKILACRRPPGRHLAGFWEFPGGKVEPGEDPKVALARELREELGIEVAVGAALPAVDWRDATVELCLRPFRCQILKGQPKALEHAEIRWCGADEWPDLTWAPADVPIVQDLARSGGA